MTIMTSGRKANHDPLPYVTPYGRVASEAANGSDYMPRPEFDVPVNPILAEFRDALMPYTGKRLAWHASQQLRRLDSFLWASPDATLAERAHARAVLTKLVAVFA